MTNERIWKLLEALGLAELPHPAPRSRHVRPAVAVQVTIEASVQQREATPSGPVVSTEIAHGSTV
jgi:hypothetical protein